MPSGGSRSPADGVLHRRVEQAASLVVLGWKGYRSTREHLFGSVIDAVLARAPAPVAVTRLGRAPVGRILLVVTGPSLEPAGRSSLTVATEIIRRVAHASPAPVHVLTDVDGPLLDRLPPHVRRHTLHYDPRRPALAVREMATASAGRRGS